MQQSEQLFDLQNLVFPLSPSLHSRRVPCQRRFSLPADRPDARKLPWASIRSLVYLSYKTVIRVLREATAYRQASYLTKDSLLPTILYTPLTGGQGLLGCLQDALNCSATKNISLKFVEKANIFLTTAERNMSFWNLQDHRSFVCSFLGASLSAILAVALLGI